MIVGTANELERKSTAEIETVDRLHEPEARDLDEIL
jgi:hypothetical protein